MYRSNVFSFVVETPPGGYGLFTQVHFRHDRVTYPFITPSAAVGLTKNIYWHPYPEERKNNKALATGEANLDVDIVRIEVIKPITYLRMTVNETEALPVGLKPIQVIGNEKSSQDSHRQTSIVVLREPGYRLYSQYVSRRSQDICHKAEEIFLRRLRKGQHHTPLCMGRRRYSAYAREPREDDVPIKESMEFCGMPLGREFVRTGKRIREILHTFDAHMIDGGIDVAPETFWTRIERLRAGR